MTLSISHAHSSPIVSFVWLAAAVLLCIAPPVRADFAIYTVGGDAACQFSQIQDAIDAAAQHPGEDYVWIASNQSYTNQHVVVTNQDVDIEGGFSDCNDFDPALDKTTLSGTSGHSVIEIEGDSHVYLAGFNITGGNLDADHRGGGIFFGGSGSLELANTSVTFNTAGYGAGIDVDGASGPVALTLDDNTLILSNTAAVSGGGIRLEGNARLFALRPRTFIAYNHAPNGYGGGLEVLGPARADIGSSGYNGAAVIYGNDAAYGGGIDILAFDGQDEAIVRLFTTDPNNPVQLSNNFASHTGGAVYMKPAIATFSFTNTTTALCAYDFRINDNAAPEGSAIYSDADYLVPDGGIGGQIAFNGFPNFGNGDSICSRTESPAALGALPCASGTVCNEIARNKAEDQFGQSTAGSTILLQDFSQMVGNRFDAHQNTGAHVIRQIGDVSSDGIYARGSATLTNCLIDNNSLLNEVIAQTEGDSADLHINACTVAGNAVGAASTFLAPGVFTLYNSIIDQPGRTAVEPTANDGGSVAHVLANDISTLPQTGLNSAGTPSFVDSTNGNYHLLPSSLGVDDAPFDPTLPALDLDGNRRLVDIPNGTDLFGPLDLGAYEVQLTSVLSCANSDTIFCNGFEIGN